MKLLLPALFIIILVYLNLSYGYYYNYIGEHFLTAPVNTNKTNSAQPKFITLGDSLMAGVGVNSQNETLANLIHQKFDPENKTELINLAVPGATITEVLENELPKALNSNPKEIVVLIGINDIHNFTRIRDFQNQYEKMVDEILSKSQAKIVLINIPLLGSSKTLLPPWNYYMDYKTKRFNEVIKRIAMEKNLKLVDLYSATKDAFKNSSDLYSQDEFHPSFKGYYFWVESINAN